LAYGLFILKIKNEHELLLLDKKYKFGLRMTTIIACSVLSFIICLGLYYGVNNMLNLIASAIFFSALAIGGSY
jgi:hypothetical protein